MTILFMNLGWEFWVLSREHAQVVRQHLCLIRSAQLPLGVTVNEVWGLHLQCSEDSSVRKLQNLFAVGALNDPHSNY